MKKMNIAIIGLGNIGSYLFKYLNKNKKFYLKRIIVSLKFYMFLQKIKIKKEILKYLKICGLKIIFKSLNSKM